MLGDIADPNWWFTAVIVAVGVNLLSSYLKHPLDRLMSFLARTYRRHYKRGREHWEGRLARAKASDRALLVEVARELRFRSKAAFHTLFVLADIGMMAYIQLQPTPLPQVTGVLLMMAAVSAVSGLVNLIRAFDVHSLVLRSVERSVHVEVQQSAPQGNAERERELRAE